MLGKIRSWFASKKAVLGAKILAAVLLVAQESGTVIDVSGLTNVMTTLIYAILPLIVVVLIFKIFGNIIKGLSDMF